MIDHIGLSTAQFDVMTVFMSRLSLRSKLQEAEGL